jgi:hypothetical protein
MDSYRLLHTTVSVTIPYNMKDGEVVKLFQSNIPDFDVTKRYVALQEQTGDCVIYENGTIDRVSDSG